MSNGAQDFPIDAKFARHQLMPNSKKKHDRSNMNFNSQKVLQKYNKNGNDAYGGYEDDDEDEATDPSSVDATPVKMMRPVASPKEEEEGEQGGEKGEGGKNSTISMTMAAATSSDVVESPQQHLGSKSGSGKKGGPGGSKESTPMSISSPLLGFSLPPRQSGSGTYHHHHHRAATGSGGEKIDPVTAKRAYILHHYQFVLFSDTLGIDPELSKKYLQLVRSFDDLPPWPLVQFVICREAFGEFQCPICLEAPRAARVTNCGHIYCYTCILRHYYQQKESNAPRSCPFCQTIITLPSLRPVYWIPVRPTQPGDVITFNLCFRNRENCQPLLGSDGYVSDQKMDNSYCLETFPQIYKEIPLFGSKDAVFCRYALSTDQLVTLVQQRDLTELQCRLAAITHSATPNALDESFDRRFTEEAMQWVSGTHEKRQLALRSQDAPLGTRSLAELGMSGTKGSSTSTVGVVGSNVGKISPELKPMSDCHLTRSGHHHQHPPQHHPKTQNSNTGAPTRPFHADPSNLSSGSVIDILYSASSGEDVHMHLMNLRMLKDQAEYLAACDEEGKDGGGANEQKVRTSSELMSIYRQYLPKTIEATVVDLESITQGQATRNTWKCFGHVPLQTSFKIAFVLFDRPGETGGKIPCSYSSISPIVMQKFQDQIQARVEKKNEVLKRENENALLSQQEAWKKHITQTAKQEWVATEGEGAGFSEADLMLYDPQELPTLEEIHGAHHEDELDADGQGSSSTSSPSVKEQQPNSENEKPLLRQLTGEHNTKDIHGGKSNKKQKQETAPPKKAPHGKNSSSSSSGRAMVYPSLESVMTNNKKASSKQQTDDRDSILKPSSPWGTVLPETSAMQQQRSKRSNNQSSPSTASSDAWMLGTRPGGGEGNRFEDEEVYDSDEAAFLKHRKASTTKKEKKELRKSREKVFESLFSFNAPSSLSSLNKEAAPNLHNSSSTTPERQQCPEANNNQNQQSTNGKNAPATSEKSFVTTTTGGTTMLKDSSEGISDLTTTWRCPACTFDNFSATTLDCCEMCQTPNPNPVVDLALMHRNDDDNHAVPTSTDSSSLKLRSDQGRKPKQGGKNKAKTISLTSDGRRN